MLTITIDQLINLKACESAKELFLAEFGDRVDIPEYTPQHQEFLVRAEWRKYLGWAWEHNVLPQWSMRGSNLRWADLSGSNLRWADLRWGRSEWGRSAWVQSEWVFGNIII
jgi:hypothetical protein